MFFVLLIYVILVCCLTLRIAFGQRMEEYCLFFIQLVGDTDTYTFTATSSKLRISKHELVSIERFLDTVRKSLNIDENDIHIAHYEVFSNFENKFVPFYDCSELETYMFRSSRLQILLHVQNLRDLSKPQLLIKGRIFDISDGLMINNQVIRLRTLGQSDLGTGLTIWDGSVLLAKYLEHIKEQISNKNVLEVGSGAGLVGISAYLLGAASVTLSDLPYTMENLQYNINQNTHYWEGNSTSITTRCIDWMNSLTYPNDQSIDVIVGADVIWLEELVIPLVNTLNAIATFDTIILIGHQTRSRYTDELFLTKMREYFQMKEV
jgi:predicted nicotinamide N-methyase